MGPQAPRKPLRKANSNRSPRYSELSAKIGELGRNAPKVCRIGVGRFAPFRGVSAIGCLRDVCSGSPARFAGRLQTPDWFLRRAE
jgi:hypothetical protein